MSKKERGLHTYTMYGQVMLSDVPVSDSEAHWWLSMGVVHKYQAFKGIMATIGGDRSNKSVFLKYFNLNSKLEFLSSFPGRFMNVRMF